MKELIQIEAYKINEESACMSGGGLVGKTFT